MTTPFTPHEPLWNNRVQAFLKVLLWLAPTGFALASAAGLNWVSNHAVAVDDLVLRTIWLILNLVFVIGTGWFLIRISIHRAEVASDRFQKIVMFVLMQVLILPPLFYMGVIALPFIFHLSP